MLSKSFIVLNTLEGDRIAIPIHRVKYIEPYEKDDGPCFVVDTELAQLDYYCRFKDNPEIANLFGVPLGAIEEDLL